MITCRSCGSDVTGKKFCPRCGTAVQPMATPALNSQSCPQCSSEVKAGTAFCTNCGHNMQSAAPPQMASVFCTSCGRQNAPGVHFCAGCGNQLSVAPAVQPNYAHPNPYTQYPQQQPPSQYPQYQQPPQYPQPYVQSPYPQQQYAPQYAQGGYQPQPMLGQSPMMLRCPTCMALAPLGSPACVSCHTSLLGVVPMPIQNQQAGGLGGFMQGNGGKYAMGALGGAAAAIGGEMLLNGVVDNVENRVEGDMGYGGHHHHHHRHREGGLLGGLGELADDIGL